MRGNDFDNSQELEHDYSHWHREHDLWERDISRWQADHQRALVDLERIAQLVVSHGEALRRHATNLSCHRKALDSIEQSGHTAPDSGPALDGLTKSHTRTREVHERIRQHHGNAVALLRAALDALRAPM
jgi:hypothetical protein